MTVRLAIGKIRLWERRKNQRVPAQTLDARYSKDGEQRRARIKDISPTDIYLVTQDRWEPGASVPLTLERLTESSKGIRAQVRLRAKVVRKGADGVCFALVHEFGKPAAWPTLMAKAVDIAPQKDAVGLFRGTKALAFLLCISPSAESRVMQLFSRRLSNEGAESATEITLKAAELVASQNLTPVTDVKPDTVVRILEEGAKTGEAVAQQFWAGLLATAALKRLEDAEILEFVNLLNQMARSHLLILSAACARTMQNEGQPGVRPGQDPCCTAEEISRMTGIQNLASVEGNLNLLCVLRLLEPIVKPWGSAQVERVNLTPTPLGLRLYIHCSGKSGLPDATSSPDGKPAS